ncbi:MAG: hypothetical protein IPH00_10565 [Flavobacteriales bacterium]|nr:hypothetical protein [Flavobacteriales bacterium]
MSATLELRSPDDVADVAKALLGAYPDQRVFAFNGPMGVGKTTPHQGALRATRCGS